MFKGHNMSNYKFLTLIISLFTLICFTIKAYAITENQYLVINKLINEENIDKAFTDLKLMQKDEVKLSARSQILIGKIYLALEQPAKAFSFFEQATFTSVSTDDLAYAGMSMSAIKLGNLSEAKTYAEKALNENPDLVEAKLALGLVFTDYGGSVFSSIYLEKPTILLNLPNDSKYLENKKKIVTFDLLVRKKILSLKFNDKYKKILITCKNALKKREILKKSVIKNSYFGNKEKINSLEKISKFLLKKIND